MSTGPRKILFISAVYLFATKTYGAAPVAVDDARTITQNTSVTINVLENDFDEDGDSLIVIATGAPENGSTQINSDGSILYTPNADFSGVDSFTYTIQDVVEGALNATATVTINVEENNYGGLLGSENTLDVARAFSNFCNNLRALGDEIGAIRSEMIERCSALETLANSNPEAATRAMRQIAPEETLSQMRNSLDASQSQTNVVSQRIASIHANGPAFSFNGSQLFKNDNNGAAAGDEESLFSALGFFMTVQAEKTEREESSLESGYETDGSNFTLGLDYRLNSSTVIGAAYGINQVNLEYQNNAGKFDSKLNTGLLFAAWNLGNFSLESQLGYSEMSFESQRLIQYNDGQTAINLSAEGETQGTQQLFSVQAQYSWNKAAFSLDPFIRINAQQNEIEAYEELGALAYSLGFSEQKASQTTVATGTQASYVFNYNWGVLIPTLQVSLMSEVDSNREEMTGYFIFDTDSENRFTMQNDGGDTSFYQFSLGASTVLKHGFSGFLQYQQLFAYEYFDAWQLQAGFRVEL